MNITSPLKNGRLAFFWTALGLLSTLAVLPYLLAVTPLPAELPAPLPVLLAAQLAQTGVLLLLFCWLGLRLGQSVGLDAPLARALVTEGKLPTLSPRIALIAVVTGILAAVAIIGLDQAFQPFMPPATLPNSINIELWKRFLASFYGGITEELLLRLGLMTLITWLIWKLVGHGVKPPAAWVFWAAIVLAAILFGVGHLPAAAGIWPLTPIVITRTVVLNALGGMAFGWLYWRWGLEYAMLAHFCADIVLHVIFGS